MVYIKKSKVGYLLKLYYLVFLKSYLDKKYLKISFTNIIILKTIQQVLS